MMPVAIAIVAVLGSETVSCRDRGFESVIFVFHFYIVIVFIHPFPTAQQPEMRADGEAQSPKNPATAHKGL